VWDPFPKRRFDSGIFLVSFSVGESWRGLDRLLADESDEVVFVDFVDFVEALELSHEERDTGVVRGLDGPEPTVHIAS
jgi:hypothetical protein